jgi:hypothetical protein
MFNTIVYFEKDNNNRFYLYFALLASNFKDFTYIFILIVNANANTFVVFILKSVNIAFKEN